MEGMKINLDYLSFLSIIYDVESNILYFIKKKIQNFILSINKLFVNNEWYNNHILKYLNYIISKKIYPIIITSLIYIKSKIPSFQLLSEEHLNTKIPNKNKFILFLLFNSFESLIIKYIDSIFTVCYSLFFNIKNNSAKINYYGKCIKKIVKHIQNLQNIILGMTFYKSFIPKKYISLSDNIDKPIKLLGYGFIIKNTYNIFQNIKNFFKKYNIEESNEEKRNEETTENKINDTSNLIENDNDDDNDDNDDNNDNICVLCLNKYNQICCTPCGHLFCWSCIHLYLDEKNNCPKCKSSCKPQEILFLRNYLSY
jgi:hypothetical protein